MVWINSLEDLQQNYQPNWVDCYCELIIDPSDLILQVPIVISPSGSYSLQIFVLNGDGSAVLEDATSYFEWVIIQAPNGQAYMNIRLKRISPAMCTNACFILNVIVNSSNNSGGLGYYLSRFNKYTERYCIDNCCIIPSNIQIRQNEESGI